ncbi:MAG: FAD-dependent oxidoreductase [Myxococcota bacterium]
MTSSPYAPDSLEPGAWDALVVGTGMGGATAGYALAERGWRVLFLERGHFLFGDADRGDGRIPDNPDESPEARLARAHFPLPIEGDTSFGPLEFFAPLGCGTGGSTSLYAAQLERLDPRDFRPRANHPQAGDSTLPEAWPISYDDLAPYYRRAEALFRVTGTPDPLHPDPEALLLAPPALSPRDQELYDSFRELGLHPYRAHAGLAWLPGCDGCPGVLCPRGCKSDAGRICLMPALEKHGARILTDCQVLGLDADASSVRAVRCRWQGRELRISAKIVVLAAGALTTPTLLLNSASGDWPAGLANRSGCVGRNLMFHASDFVAVRPRRRLSALGPRKALSLNDFYLHEGAKLGTFQSVGISVDPGYVLYYLRSVFQKAPKWQRALIGPFLRVVARLAALYFDGAAVFASIVEDLPYWENRVVPDPRAANGLRFEYRYPEELRERTRLSRRALGDSLRSRHRTMVLSGENNLNFGHTCGTCRFGDDPATSVLDRDNRAHGVANLFVVDASFFPSSGGTNPSLTIAANALRAAEAMHRQLAAT